MFISPRHILARHGLKPQKKLGQHFLINPHTTQQIVEKAGVEPGDIVVEIGAGLGALTLPLAQKAKRVIAIEYDKRLMPVLKEVLQTHQLENVEIWWGDALKYDYEKKAREFNHKIKIIGNLPYYISSPLLFLFLYYQPYITGLTLMLQKEVSERLKAKPGTKVYGLLSVLYGLIAEVKVIMTLHPASFYPPPQVASQVVKINWRPEGKRVEKPFITFLKHIFSHRRKTIMGALKGYLQVEEIKKVLLANQIAPHLRPEQISPEQFLGLYHTINKSLRIRGLQSCGQAGKEK